MRNGEGRREMVWPSDDGKTEPAIKVLMDRDRVVVRPVGQFDADALRAVVDLVGCAREAGVVAVIDLGGIEFGSGVVARLITDASQRSPSRSCERHERHRSRRRITTATGSAIVRACRYGRFPSASCRRAFGPDGCCDRTQVRSADGRLPPSRTPRHWSRPAQAALDRSLASPTLHERLGDHPTGDLATGKLRDQRADRCASVELDGVVRLRCSVASRPGRRARPPPGLRAGVAGR
jgi:hypothetical protein